MLRQASLICHYCLSGGVRRGAYSLLSFHLVAQLVDAKAIEFDLMQPFITFRHRFGVLGMAGLDELEEHAQSLDEPGAPRQVECVPG
jgi:hypothetical protein